MSEFVRAARITDLQEGDLENVSLGATTVLLAKTGGRFYATEPLCPHLEADLSEGSLSGAVLTCPMHGSQFDLRDGHVVRWTDLTGVKLQFVSKARPPRPLRCYPVRVEGDDVLVGLP